MGPPVPLRHTAAAFLASFLAFHLELAVAKALLPRYGGSASVWTTSVMVFQGLVFLSALYAILLSRLNRRNRAGAHLTLLLAGAAAPLMPARSVEWICPEASLALELLAAAGLPFLALASAAAVLDDWLGRRESGPLYAASNAGALAALAAFPLALEPLLPLDWQLSGWRLAYLALAGLLAACRPGPAPLEPAAPPPAPSSVEAGWLLAAAAPAAAMLAASHALALDFAAGPLLWAAPLAVYLATLAGAFKREPWEPATLARLLAAAALAWQMLFAAAGGWAMLSGAGSQAPRAVLAAGRLAVDLGALALLSLACHRGLAASKPAEPAHAARYYAWVALGGWAGGLLVAVGLPLAARRSGMLSLDWLAAGLLGLAAASRAAPRARAWILGGCAAAAAAWATGSTLWSLPADRRLLESIRNFYGIHGVAEGGGVRELYHGGTLHGQQRLGEPRRPSAYYDERGPAGDAFRAWGRSVKRVAVVGLGVGALAAYAEPGQRWDFYELDPDVASIAKRHFTYLADCRASCAVRLGDGRLGLAGAEGEVYDLIVLDAFHADSVPTHLATSEAAAVYLRRLAPEGALLFHVSSRLLDLRPVFAGLAAESRLHGVSRRARSIGAERYATSTWTAMSRSPRPLAPLKAAGWRDLEETRPAKAWTDRHASLLPAVAASLRLATEAPPKP